MHLQPLLESTRAQFDLPALAAARISSAGITEIAVAGVRKRGINVEARVDDHWHLGSCTKMMTATLVGTFVAQGRLSWDTPVAPLFPDAEPVHEDYRSITIGHLLSHRARWAQDPPHQLFFDMFQSKPPAGDLAGIARWLADVREHQPPLPVQRERVAITALRTAPIVPPGAWTYSNAGYITVGAILERLTGQSWEQLMAERIFTPLGMASAGFYGVGTPGLIDHPWPHGENGDPLPRNGPAMDGFPATGPAGMVHCAIADWCRFAVDQLRGATDRPALLPPGIYAAIHAAHADNAFGGKAGYGWFRYGDPAASAALSHSGSNGMNFCLITLLPHRDVGVLVCMNQGSAKSHQACQELTTKLLNDASPDAVSDVTR